MALLPAKLLCSRRAWVAALCCGVAAIVLWFVAAYPRGAVAAYLEHTRGHREVKTFGYPPPERREYARLLRERYGVEVNVVAGCVVTEELVQYVKGYNAVSKWLLKEEFGRDIFAECWEEARRKRQAEHPEEGARD
jgi:hypothetical protein